MLTNMLSIRVAEEERNSSYNLSSSSAGILSRKTKRTLGDRYTKFRK